MPADAVVIRPAADRDFEAIVRINHEAEAYLNSQAALTVADVRELAALAAYFKVASVGAEVAGFVVAVSSGTAHADPNYVWFSARFAPFLYIDRIVVAAHARGRGVGSALYTDLFEFARARGATRLTCEIDCDPPNHASSEFHRRFGFGEVGRHAVDGGKKTVSLQLSTV